MLRHLLDKTFLHSPRFFLRTLDVVGDDTVAIEQFITDFDAYVKSVAQEADDRVYNRIRNVDDYFVLRRDTCGAKPSFSFFALGLNLPKAVFDHPLMGSLIECAADLVAITNVSPISLYLLTCLPQKLTHTLGYALVRIGILEGPGWS